ncbi:HEPN family nuclease [Fusobacterium sp. FSA-380-WT-3A]|uniref:HEPN family nuclease n=1 Tax=Fusobacterium sp. FSA-380-WT-3A TaxID=2725304 RepID=UPI00147748DD|nr:HEPN family nuclease [Fusobacterium sp. FSA-380-WT-3A]NME35323.1 hypothetical protein [Fusobacterium sp. FSA-380-WT-3A]
MEYPITKVEQEFFKRTFKLAERYKEFDYDVTFLINCLYGIIIVAQSNFYSSLAFKFGKNIEGVNYKKNGEEVELRNVKLRHLLTIFRNSLAHFGDMREGENYGRDNIKFESTPLNEIGKIKFKNKSGKAEIEFNSSKSLFLFIEELEKLFKDKRIIY